jgi:hypothetical protein
MDAETGGIPLPTPKSFAAEGNPLGKWPQLIEKDLQIETRQAKKMHFDDT